jgi:hypothetical protein
MEAAEGEDAAFVGSRSGLDLTWVRHRAVGSGRLPYLWRDLELGPRRPAGDVLGVDPVHLPVVRLNGRRAITEIRSGDPVSSPLAVELLVPRESLFADSAFRLSLGLWGGPPRTVPWDETPAPGGDRRFHASLGIPEGRHRITLSIGATPYVDLDVTVAEALRISELLWYPNPFRDSGELQFRLSRDAEVRVRIHAVSGTPVARLGPFACAAGFNAVAWDGRDDVGHAVANGAYFARIEARGDGGRAARRAVILRAR